MLELVFFSILSVIIITPLGYIFTKHNNNNIINLSNDKYFIDGKLYDELDYNIINSEWVFINDNFITSQNEIENILSGYHDNDIILLKTLYPDNVYPTLSDIQNGNIMIDKINFCIKTKYR